MLRVFCRAVQRGVGMVPGASRQGFLPLDVSVRFLGRVGMVPGVGTQGCLPLDMKEVSVRFFGRVGMIPGVMETYRCGYHIDNLRLRINNLCLRNKELAKAVQHAGKNHEERMERSMEILLRDITTEATEIRSAVRRMWNGAADSSSELQIVSERISDILRPPHQHVSEWISDILRQPHQHKEEILDIVEDINSALETEQARFKILRGYCEWVEDLRDYLLLSLREETGKNYTDWMMEIETELWKEKLWRTGQRNRDPMFEALSIILAKHDMTTVDLEAVLDIHYRNILSYCRNEFNTAEEAIQALEEIAFPSDMIHLKDPLRKTIKMIEAVWDSSVWDSLQGSSSRYDQDDRGRVEILYNELEKDFGPKSGA